MSGDKALHPSGNDTFTNSTEPRLRARIAELEAENERLREFVNNVDGLQRCIELEAERDALRDGIRLIIEEGYPAGEVGVRCAHGRHWDQDCMGCVDDELSKLLEE